MTNTVSKILKGDKIIILVVLLLMLISALLVGSTSPSLAIQNNNFSFSYLFKQLFLSGFGFLIMIFVSKIPYKIYFKISKGLLIFSLILLLITIITGETTNDTKRWLSIPFTDIKFQTSDLVRFALLIHIAKIISEYNANKDDLKNMFRRVLYWALPIIAVISFINVSTAILMGVIVFTILFFTPINKKFYFKILGIVFIAGILLLTAEYFLKIGRGGTIGARTVGSDGFQKEQCLIAVSNANVIPNPGGSKQKFLLAHSNSDFIFAIAVEEYGFIGILGILGLYFILLYRIALIVRKQERSFPMFLVLGLSMNILLQAFMHLFVNVGIGPVTGQPLPLVSMGGTAIVITCMQIGIILNISSLHKKKTAVTAENLDKIEDDKEEQKQDEIKKSDDIEINDYPFLVG